MTHNVLEDLRPIVPQVLGALVRRGADVAAAEDAVQEALVEAWQRWPDAGAPEHPAAWLRTVAGRKLIDAQRSEIARRDREERVADEPAPGPTEQDDDTLLLLVWCCHPSLTPASAVALTLRAVGGLTTRQIAAAYLVPEATMAQRISRAKRSIGAQQLGSPGAVGDLRTVLTVLYLMFNEGHSGDVDLAAEAIRLTRTLARASSEPETAGLLALTLLHHSRRTARWDVNGGIVPLADQDRSRWDTELIAEGVGVLQAALAVDRVGDFQCQAAIAALHCDAPSAAETDWPQILSWYDELQRHNDSPVVALNRVVAVGETDGPLAGLRALSEVPDDLPRRRAVEAWLRERAGETAAARELYRRAAAEASSEAERTHLTKQAARLHQI